MTKRIKSSSGRVYIPAKFEVKGREWKVELIENLMHEQLGPCNGLCWPGYRLIQIEKNLSMEERLKTFIHELGHAIIKECHLDEAGCLDQRIEEIICSGFADVLCCDILGIK